ncbi:MAG: propanediol utilization protein, partial [Clostridia bacterium]|nr:propanediol utilization protein [Clostridia bacterium]
MEKTVLVEISARHVHVSEKDLEILFGKGYKLTPKKD